MSDARRWLKDRWIRRPAIDWFIAIALVGGHLIASRRWQHLDVLPDGGDLTALFRLLAGTAATLVGFLLTAMIFFYSLPQGMRRKAAEASIGDSLFGAWRRGLAATSAALLITLVAAAWTTAPARWVAEFLVVLIALRYVRLFIVLMDFVNLFRADQHDPEVPTADVPRPRAQV